MTRGYVTVESQEGDTLLPERFTFVGCNSMDAFDAMRRRLRMILIEHKGLEPSPEHFGKRYRLRFMASGLRHAHPRTTTMVVRVAFAQ